MENSTSTPKFAFFGTPELAVTALEVLAKLDYTPSLIVTNPDAPTGRKKIITPPPVKIWAGQNNIPVIQPTSLKNEVEISPLLEVAFDFFVVFAYGKIIPETLLTRPRYGTINAHPSLLPKLRGASPIRSTLLHDLSAAGVTIIQMDKELDHGDILLQKPIPLPHPIPGTTLDSQAAAVCGELLAEAMKNIPLETITPTPQDHSQATFCTKITKDMAELQFDPKNIPTGEDAFTMYKKICAFDDWPIAFFIHNSKRIKISKASFTPENMTLQIEKVIPEGKKEIAFTDYLRSQT